MTITQKQLKDNRWHRFSWNNGSIIEYWKPLDSSKNFDYRLGVRFGEYVGALSIVYLFAGHSYTPLTHIQSYDQLQNLYSSLYNPHYQTLQDFVLSNKDTP